MYTHILFYKFLIYDMFVADFKLYRSFILISAENNIFKRYFVFANWFVDGQQLRNDIIAWRFTIVDCHVTELFEFIRISK